MSTINYPLKIADAVGIVVASCQPLSCRSPGIGLQSLQSLFEDVEVPKI